MKPYILGLAMLAVSSSFGIDFGRVMLTGDSNVAGAGGSAQFSFRYPLHQKLLLNGHTKDFVGKVNWGGFADGSQDNQHSGFGGWGMHQTLTGFMPDNVTNLGQGKYSDWLSTYSPDTVVFLSGINDFWRWGGTTYLTNPNAPAQANAFFRTSYESVFNQTFSANPNMRLVVLGYFRTEYTDLTNPGRNAMLRDLNILLAQMEVEQRALGRNVNYVDLYSITESGGHTFDGVHLNAYGANLVADAALSGMVESVPEPASMIGVALCAALLAKRRSKKA